MCCLFPSDCIVREMLNEFRSADEAARGLTPRPERPPPPPFLSMGNGRGTRHDRRIASAQAEPLGAGIHGAIRNLSSPVNRHKARMALAQDARCEGISEHTRQDPMEGEINNKTSARLDARSPCFVSLARANDNCSPRSARFQSSSKKRLLCMKVSLVHLIHRLTSKVTYVAAKEGSLSLWRMRS